MVHQAIHTYTSGVRFGSKIGWDLTAGPVAQWITRLTTDQKIPGSNPGRFGNFSGNITELLSKYVPYMQSHRLE